MSVIKKRNPFWPAYKCTSEGVDTSTRKSAHCGESRAIRGSSLTKCILFCLMWFARLKACSQCRVSLTLHLLLNMLGPSRFHYSRRLRIFRIPVWLIPSHYKDTEREWRRRHRSLRAATRSSLNTTSTLGRLIRSSTLHLVCNTFPTLLLQEEPLRG